MFDAMQKSSVKTLSIIDTLSELAHDENEASRLALPSPISVQRGTGNRLSSKALMFQFNKYFPTHVFSYEKLDKPITIIVPLCSKHLYDVGYISSNLNTKVKQL